LSKSWKTSKSVKRSNLSFTSGIIHQDSHSQEQEYQKTEATEQKERTNNQKEKEGSSRKAIQSYPFSSANLLPEMTKIRKLMSTTAAAASITLNIR
jgi:hypothetical protein